MFIFAVVKSVGILMSIFGHNYTIFVIGRFLVGGGYIGIFLPGYVLRQYASIFLQYLFLFNASRF